MSWLPDNDPVLGDVKPCDALELVIVPRTRDLDICFEPRFTDIVHELRAKIAQVRKA